MQRVRITLAYDGTEFFGSQVQPGVRTVQGELDRALCEVCSKSGRTAFAGRTDRGVHAAGQVVSVDVEWASSLAELRRALEATTADDIAVVDVAGADDAFHARYSACWREYRYRFAFSPSRPVLHQRYAWWRRVEIDNEAASKACMLLVGTHAFGSFAGSGKSAELSRDELVRRVYSCDWRNRPGDWQEEGIDQRELRIVASGFLPQMVRNIATAVIDVGRGVMALERIQYLLVAGDRSLLGAPAPPHGLVLWRVGYDEHWSAEAQ